MLTLDQIAHIFDARAPRYAHDDWHRRYAESLVAATPLNPGDRVLDAASGTGFAARAIAARVGPSGRVVGVDISPGMLDQSRQAVTTSRLQNVVLLCGDAGQLLPIAAGSMDAVVCAAGLLYMPVSSTLLAWARVLKQGGAVAFSTMRAGCPSSARIFREVAIRRGLQIPDPNQPLGSESRCRQALEGAGFVRVQVHAGRVDFDRLDPELAWEANVRAASALVPALTSDVQQAMREEFLEALQREMASDRGAATRGDVLFAVAHRPSL